MEKWGSGNGLKGDFFSSRGKEAWGRGCREEFGVEENSTITTPEGPWWPLELGT